MQAFEILLQRHPLVFFHLITALAALVVGGIVLFRRKGTTSHKALGWSWVMLMGCTALARPSSPSTAATPAMLSASDHQARPQHGLPRGRTARGLR